MEGGGYGCGEMRGAILGSHVIEHGNCRVYGLELMGMDQQCSLCEDRGIGHDMAG